MQWVNTTAWVSDILRKAVGQSLLVLQESTCARVGAEGQEPSWASEAAFPAVQLPEH